MIVPFMFSNGFFPRVIKCGLFGKEISDFNLSQTIPGFYVSAVQVF